VRNLKSSLEKYSSSTMKRVCGSYAMTPDFKTYQERDTYFAENAEYFTLVKKTGVGHYDRTEFKTLEEATKAAHTRQTVGGGGWMIYAVIGEQSAFVKAIK
jgi:hypothetical protein